MVKRPHAPDDESPDELSYEDFEDTAWDADAEIPVIDLDALDDDIPGESDTAPTEPDQAAVSLMDTLDHLHDDVTASLAEAEAAPEESLLEVAPDEPPAPEAGALHSAPPDETIVSETPAPLQTEEVSTPSEPVAPVTSTPQVDEPEALPEPEAAPDVYCALLPLPPDLADQIAQLRKTGKITTMPPPGIVLTVLFHTRDLPAVEAALTKWARAHLPFQLEITGVLAKVIGAQQYIAAWTLEPEEELLEAQHALRQALADLILPVPGAAGTFNAWVPVGDHIAAARYPHVIGQMQRDYEPFAWHANDLQLVRQGEPWENVTTFD